MRRLMMVVLFALVAVWGCSQSQSTPAPKTEDEKAFYSLGVQLNKQLSMLDMSAEEMKLVQKGMSDAAAGKKLEAEPEAHMKKFGELAQARMVRATEKQKAQAKAFLEKAAQEKGAVKTESGLIYQEIKAGTGAQPKPTDVVKVHYVGKLIDGKEFDSSVKRGEPAELPLGQILPCWTEGVAKMKVGGKSKLVCPSDIAYGDRGRPPVIPGGATLIFEIELLDAKAGQAMPSMPGGPSKQPIAKPPAAK
ncbi:MAG TPA: FKBP-type peptidyl-prolyl cis-trans isomerase [Smithellaceae bacterium]|nr:FKBP-type peptidyl-prolyl cis-trans isomerase [Smithellaceae bacterium]HQM45238.1 FKBP-type peptidyl-prolyl cis-trans isomerase [Smithellaceae bacterium]